MSLRATHTTRSQKGNVAHTVRQSFRRSFRQRKTQAQGRQRGTGHGCPVNRAGWKPTLPQKKLRGRVRKAQSSRGQAKACGVKVSPAALDQAVDFGFPFDAEIEAGELAERLEAPARIHAQTEGCGFTGALERRQFFAPLDGAVAVCEFLAIKQCVR